MVATVRGSAISGLITTRQPVEEQLQFESPEVRVLKALEPLTRGESPKLSLETRDQILLKFDNQSSSAHVEHIEMVAHLAAANVLNRAETSHYLTASAEQSPAMAKEIQEGLSLKRMLWEMANYSETPLPEGHERFKAIVPDKFEGLGLWGAVRELERKVEPLRFRIDYPEIKPVAPIPSLSE